MAESEFHEKLSIRESARSLKKYGSTSNHMKRQETLIKHPIVGSDTLQGIALKYGVTMEQIRRTNKLWASDSLFLREYLMIPVPCDSPFSPTEEFNTLTASVSTNNNTSRNSVVADDSIDEPTIDDFLENIDNSIAITKKEVKKAQGNSEFIHEMDRETSYPRRKPVSRLRQANTSGSSQSKVNLNPPPDLLTSSPPAFQHFPTPTNPPTVPMVVTQTGKKLRSSLQRLEQQQDEMFEL